MYFKILLATDLTKDGHKVDRKAWELANQFDAKLFIIHVIEPIPAYGYPGVTDIESPHIEEAKAEMKKLAGEFMVPDDRYFVEVGPTKTLILDKADEIDADLIVVGSHGRHGLSRLLGSTANAILHGAKCDVVTVRYKD